VRDRADRGIQTPCVLRGLKNRARNRKSQSRNLAENGGARGSSMDGMSGCRNHLSIWLNGQKGVERVLAKIDALEGGGRLAESRSPLCLRQTRFIGTRQAHTCTHCPSPPSPKGARVRWCVDSLENVCAGSMRDKRRGYRSVEHPEAAI